MTVRAQLELYAELASMGDWDFLINMSGSDLPLRYEQTFVPGVTINIIKRLAPHAWLDNRQSCVSDL